MASNFCYCHDSFSEATITKLSHRFTDFSEVSLHAKKLLLQNSLAAALHSTHGKIEMYLPCHLHLSSGHVTLSKLHLL